MANKHVLFVAFPAQGHINPSLQFAKRLAKHGVKVTFLTTLSAIRRMTKTSSSSFNGLIDFVSFSDGYDNGWSNDDNVQDYMLALSSRGTKAVEDTIIAKREEEQPFTRVIYAVLIPWAGQVARRLQVPATLLWIQPAIVFGLYFHYFHKNFDPRNEVIELPGLPVIESRDLPSFFQATNPSIYDFAIPAFREHFDFLDGENYPTVLVNTFDALEPDALRAINNYRLMPIGPLIPSAFLDGNDPSDTSFGGDLIQKSVDYVQYLDSKEKLSVIYIAFGSYSEISKLQMEEIAKGLIKSRRPFLWVIRGSENSEKLDEILSCREDLEKQGKIVAWCTQVEVLSHPSVGCFLTHCGWNSTLESLVSGVPLVMLPQWSDQATNAKLIQDFWRTGVKLVKPENGGPVEADEINKCLETVMDGGGRAEEIRRQARKWRDLAREAVKEDGASSVNLKIFLDQLLVGNI